MYDVADLRAQLGSFGLTVRDIPGDGNCLFRFIFPHIMGKEADLVRKHQGFQGAFLFLCFCRVIIMKPLAQNPSAFSSLMKKLVCGLTGNIFATSCHLSIVLLGLFERNKLKAFESLASWAY